MLKKSYNNESKALSELEEIKVSISNASRTNFLATMKYLFNWDVLNRYYLRSYYNYCYHYTVMDLKLCVITVSNKPFSMLMFSALLFSCRIAGLG